VVTRSGRRSTGGCTIARHGGEEFSLILPNADVAAAVKVAERLRKAIEKAEWPHRPVTASFGVASLSTENADPTAVIAAADKALYRSKTRGRNRVTAARN
jgi:diguanylate cyclase (GGDEF)-like protein